ncbi:elongation factor Tu [Mycobacterium manitobense]|uniref:Elongation factor Tu n=1 Tax=[Mycobacterium] manitobense TaxID=190147 RepID=A0A9X3BLU0_9MYCO|nr:EF-Tu/IF-2/RF-3 family GTPase [[Mycobacterium] manitobense]MCV7169260.1 elongation factor Tu [[Mycobacterium] manitobense]
MFSMTVQDVFAIRRRGVVAHGVIDSGTVRVGDVVRIGGGVSAPIDAIEVVRKPVDEAGAGDTVGLLFRGLESGQITQGAVLTSDGTQFLV